MTHRLFIAAEIQEEIKSKLIHICKEVYGNAGNIKWEQINKLHITLKFLGNVGENLTDVVVNQLNKIIYDKFTARFSRFGLFTKNGIPKILWVGIMENSELENLKIKIEKSMEFLGFQIDTGKFKPHITVARLKGKEDSTKINNLQQIDLSEIKFEIEKILLIKSILKPNGSEYSIIKSFNLI